MAQKKTPGRLSRLAQLGTLTGRVTTSYVRERVKELVGGSELGQQALDKLHLDNARAVVDTMSRLKGAAMKVGQQVAMLADTLDLPDEVGQVLGKLHAEAEPIPFAQIVEDVEASLGRPLTEAFSRFDPTPLGTASLAQAHTAALPDGTEVVVKVLHRGVDDSVTTDLMALKGILLSSRGVAGRSKAEVDDIFDELRDRLLEELDYLQEAANIAAYQATWGDDPRVRIPRVHPGWSTERVLTMDRVPGRHIDAFVATASPEARQRAARTVAGFYYEQVFRHRMLHADPHPGNYLFDEDGTLGVLDFGCVKRIDEFWVGTYARAVLCALDHDKAGTLDACIDLGAWDGVDPAAGDALWAFVREITKAFEGGERELGGPDEHFLEDMRPVIKGLIPHPSVRAPKDILMLHRSLGGLYALERKLRARLDFREAMEPHARYAVARAHGEVA
ncbi:MAG: AarF/ABC1/UbiB kinase family protein [Alphaproteobacteria bacterium]|nr:AarF/ABC1/UbiB kinase family protein [Alphaproteobacteria bacterium]